MSNVNLNVAVTETSADVTVSSAAGSDGAAISPTPATAAVRLTNVSRLQNVQYKVGAGMWVTLTAERSVRLEVDLSITDVYLRQQVGGVPSTVRVVTEVMSSDFFADTVSVGSAGGGGGGGAEAFTDLTDAPETITPNAVLAGDGAGSAVAFLDHFTYEDESRTLTLHTLDSGGGSFYIESDSANAQGALYADDAFASVGVGLGNGGSIQFEATVDGIKMNLQTGPFAMANMDIAATDTNARLIVGEASYAIEKAIQVKVGEVTYYWPLFGGEPAGPSPISVGEGGIDIDAPGGLSLTSTTGNELSIEGGGGVSIEALNSGDVTVISANDVFVNTEALDLTVTSLKVNNETAVATQSVLVAGVGTMVFTHGILTSFTPA